VQTTGAPATIQLSPSRKIVNADGEDCSIVDVSVVDSKGRVVPTADNLIHFELSGPGKIIGVGNGDPSCHEPDKCEGNWQRSAFNGYAQVIVQADKSPKRSAASLPPRFRQFWMHGANEKIVLVATAKGLETAKVEISLKHVTPRPSVP
jgi:hypothetical protein